MDMKTIGIVVVVVAVGFTIYMEVQKRTTFAKLEAYLREGDLNNYLKVLNRPLTSVLYPKYNVLFMRLNAALAMDDVEASERIIREMGSLKMSEEQTLALAAKAFSFYVEIGDEPHAREVLSYLEEHGDREARVPTVAPMTSSSRARMPISTRWSARCRRRLAWKRPCSARCSRFSTRTRVTRGAPRPIASALSGRSQQPCLTSREESRRFIC